MSHRLLRATLDLLPPPCPGVELEHGLRRRWLHLVEVTLDVLYPADGQAPADEDLELTDDTLVELVDQALTVAVDMSVNRRLTDIYANAVLPPITDEALAELEVDQHDQAAPPRRPFGPYVCRDCGRQFPTQGGLGGHRAHCAERRAKVHAAELEVEARKAGASKPQAPSASSLAVFAGTSLTSAAVDEDLEAVTPASPRAAPVILPSTAELAAREEDLRLRARIAATKADSLGSRRTITSPDPNAYPKD